MLEQRSILLPPLLGLFCWFVLCFAACDVLPRGPWVSVERRGADSLFPRALLFSPGGLAVEPSPENRSVTGSKEDVAPPG